MRRLFFSFAIIFFIPCFSPGDLIAQTAKGDQLFGVMATVRYPGFRPFQYGTDRYDLYYQRFIAPRFSLGVNANLDYQHIYYFTRAFSFGTGIEARYYFRKKASAFQPYGFGGLETNWHRMIYQDVTTSSKWLGLQANTGVGFDWYIRPGFALNARAGINFADMQSGHPSASWNFKVGATFLIPRKEKQKPVLPQ